MKSTKAMKSIRDMIRGLTGERTPNRDTADVLRTLATLRFGLETSGLSLDAFAREHVDRGRVDSSSLAYRWARGETGMSERTALRLEERLPGIARVHAHPVFDLLREPSLTVADIERLLSRYTTPGYKSWWFGDEEERGVVAGPVRTHTPQLVERGDLEGFTVILGLVRQAEAENDVDAHIHRFADLYRAFPAAARVSWIRPFVPLLRHCVEKLQFKSFYTMFWWRVDWKLIQKQIRAAQHETVRHRCPRDPKTYAFIMPEDPISMAIEKIPEIVGNPLKRRGWAGKALRS